MFANITDIQGVGIPFFLPHIVDDGSCPIFKNFAMKKPMVSSSELSRSSDFNFAIFDKKGSNLCTSTQFSSLSSCPLIPCRPKWRLYNENRQKLGIHCLIESIVYYDNNQLKK